MCPTITQSRTFSQHIHGTMDGLWVRDVIELLHFVYIRVEYYVQIMPQKLFFIHLILLISCNDNDRNEVVQNRVNVIDEIIFDESIDSKDFSLCFGENNVLQYFNTGNGLEYKGGKRSIDDKVKKEYNPKMSANESGLVRLRFIVDCEGKGGRFRVLGMDWNWKEKEFSESITNQLVRIVKSLNGWKIKYDGNNYARDYYQYLIFKIEDGQIVKILP